MPLRFYNIALSQFLSELADNTLLILSMYILMSVISPKWAIPMLKCLFTLSYILTSFFSGGVADAYPKSYIMIVSNVIKLLGCLTMIFYAYIQYKLDIDVWIVILSSYAIIGLGCSIYSPAKYGIIAEVLTKEHLIIGNGITESLVVIASILGTVIGGLLSNSTYCAIVDTILVKHRLFLNSPIEVSIIFIMLIYMLSLASNFFIPTTKVAKDKQKIRPILLINNFLSSVKIIYKDDDCVISLLTTALWWGCSSVMQLIIIEWAIVVMHYSLSQASVFQLFIALGIIIGAGTANKLISIKDARNVVLLQIPTTIVLYIIGLCVPIKIFNLLALTCIGIFGGLVLVPMNSLFQFNGSKLVGGGSAISVQLFHDSLGMLIFSFLFSIITATNLSMGEKIDIFATIYLLSSLFIISLHLKFKKNRSSKQQICSS